MLWRVRNEVFIYSPHKRQNPTIIRVNEEFPSYRRDPLYWKSFWTNFYFFLKHEFSDMEVERDVIAVVATLIVTNVVLIWLTSPDQWFEHPLWILSVVLINAAAGLLGPCLLRIGIALWKTYCRPRFRGFGWLTASGIAALILWALGFWYDDYVHSPHFDVQITSSVTGDAVEHSPSTGVAFVLGIANSGVPSRTKNWQLEVTIDGEEQPIISREVIRDYSLKTRNGGLVFPKDNKSIDQETMAHPVDKDEVRGNIAFVFKGYRRDMIDAPSTKALLSFEDDKGYRHKFPYKFPAHVVEVSQ